METFPEYLLKCCVIFCFVPCCNKNQFHEIVWVSLDNDCGIKRKTNFALNLKVDLVVLGKIDEINRILSWDF